MEHLEVLKERLKRLEKQYDENSYFGKRSDLLCEISQLKVKIEREEEKK